MGPKPGLHTRSICESKMCKIRPGSWMIWTMVLRWCVEVASTVVTCGHFAKCKVSSLSPCDRSSLCDDAVSMPTNFIKGWSFLARGFKNSRLLFSQSWQALTSSSWNGVGPHFATSFSCMCSFIEPANFMGCNLGFLETNILAYKYKPIYMKGKILRKPWPQKMNLSPHFLYVPKIAWKIDDFSYHATMVSYVIFIPIGFFPFGTGFSQPPWGRSSQGRRCTEEVRESWVFSISTKQRHGKKKRLKYEVGKWKVDKKLAKSISEEALKVVKL